MIIYIDMMSGISGDMILGALIDLGVPEEWLVRQLRAIPLSGFDLKVERIQKNHLNAVNLQVNVTDTITSRHYSDIKTLIDQSGLSETVKQNSLAAFEKIATAEAYIHNQDPDHVHFHEVGGIDSIVDIIGTFLCVEYLDISNAYASIVPLGTGTISCSHGIIPVPVPATVFILKGVPVRGTSIPTELVTPTGAAILTTLTSSFGPMPQMTLDQTGYGAGKRDMGSHAPPNLLRIISGEMPGPVSAGSDGYHQDRVCVVQANIDDMIPEFYGFIMDRLFDIGALDVCHIPIQMKKNRPAALLEVICPVEKQRAVMELILSQSTSTGVRYHMMDRQFLKREIVDVPTRFGRTPVKKITRPDNRIQYVPEYEVCCAIAKNQNLALKDVYDQINGDLSGSNN